MKVCIVRNAESRTNASILRILDALLSSGKDCVLLTRSRYEDEKGVVKKEHYHDGQIIDNYQINIKSETGRGLINIFQLIYYQFIIFKWLIRNKDKYDIIHSFDLDSGLPVLLASKINKKKYVYHVADFYVDSRGGIPKILKVILRKLEYIIISNAETTIICTEERKQQIQGSKPKNLVVIHNVPSIKINIKEKINAELNTNEHRNLTFTYVGGLSEMRFIKSIIDIFKNRPELNLELAGMGKLSNYARQASKTHNNIKYHGMIKYEDALSLYSKSDVMFAIYDPTIANHKYSAPNKVYEAMMLGKPIVVAKGTGIDKLVDKEKIGISIDYTQKDFENAIDYIVENPKYFKELGNNAKNTYKFYSWDQMKRKLIYLYNDIEKEY